MDRSVLARKPMTELKDIASHLDMRGYQKLRKAELIDAIVASATGHAAGSGEQGDTLFDQGGGASARKVLPPGARQGDNGDGSEPEQADDEESTADDDAAGDDPDDDQQSRGRRNRSRNRSGRDEAGAGSEQDADADEQDDDDDGDHDAGRKRSRRDRRTRNRDRGDDEGGRGQSDDDGQSRGSRGKGDDGSSSENRSDGSHRDDGGSKGGQGKGGGSKGGQSKGDQSKGDGRTGKNGDKKSSGGQSKGEQSNRENEPGEVRAGVLDILPEGYGFLRTTGYLPGDRDVYVSQGQIRKHNLRRGDVVQGPVRQQRSNEKVPALHHVQRVNGGDLVSGKVADRADFRRLTAVHADEVLTVTGPDAPPILKAVDLLAPIGRGHRGLILAPYAGGRTELIKTLANGLADHSPDVHLMVVLVDERPEDVTDVERSVPGETISSTFDHPVDEHAQVAELALERAKRLVELGHDVVILLDSLTRLARAHGGGAAAGAVQAAKRFFGAARNVEEGGSLTIIATLQTDTGSEVDDTVARELQTTANVIIGLDGEIERESRPAIRPDQTQTLREERLLDDGTLDSARSRRADVLGGAEGLDATRAVLNAFS